MTVVVDYAALGLGPPVVRCDLGTPANGLDALAGAGFSVALVTGEPFVCRIDGQPAQQTCDSTPPANAYWGYWHAQRGGTWAYSPSGASSSHPAQGSVEGWAFETDGNVLPPSAAPPAPTPTSPPRPTATPTPKPTPTATPRPTAAPTPTARPTPTTTTRPLPSPSAAASVITLATAGASTTATDMAGAVPPPQASTTPSATGASAVPGPSLSSVASPVASTGTGDSGGSPAATLAGIALVVVVVGLGGAAARRRRSPGS